MVCKKCNHELPNDSEYCQYCGKKIEKEESVKGLLDEKRLLEKLTNPNITQEEASEELLKFQAKSTIDTMMKNKEAQPNNEADEDFGLVPQKPIFTFALKSVAGEREYLDKLYTSSGEKIKYTRRGSTIAEGVNGIIDIYDTFLPSGQPYKTIYINMYGAETSEVPPKGFIRGDALIDLRKINTPSVESKKGHFFKFAVCSKRTNKFVWGIVVCLLIAIIALIGQNVNYANYKDAHAHYVSTVSSGLVGCGSIGCKYCKGVRLSYAYNEYGYPIYDELFQFYYTNSRMYDIWVSIADIAFILFFVLSILCLTLCGIRYKNNIKKFLSKVFKKKNIIKVIIGSLLIISLMANLILSLNLVDLDRSYQTNRDKVSLYEENARENALYIANLENKINFFDKHIVFISDDATNIYHKYGCYRFDTTYFWAYNTERAVQLGYSPCDKCCG